MKRTKIYSWLPKELFNGTNPLNAVILGVETTSDNDTILRLSIDKAVYQMSLWGKNLNTLIDKFGDDDVFWIGKTIQIMRVLDVNDGKNKTILS